MHRYTTNPAPASPDREQDWRRQMAMHLHESLGDVLELTGQHDEARDAYAAALVQVPAYERIWQARLQRKTGSTWREQQCYNEALHAYDQAENVLG